MDADTDDTVSDTSTTSSSTYVGIALGGPRDHGKLGEAPVFKDESSRSGWTLGLVAIGSLTTREVLASFYARLTSTEKRGLANLYPAALRTAPHPLAASARRTIKPGKEGGALFLAVDSTGSFLLGVYSKDAQYPQRLAFALLGEVEKLVQDAIAQAPSCSGKGGALEKRLRQPMRRLLAKYDDSAGLDKTAEVLKKVDDVKIQVRDNLQKILGNQEDLEGLSGKTEGMAVSAHTFQKTTEEANRALFWSSSRLLICIIIIFGLGVVVSVYVAISCLGGR